MLTFLDVVGWAALITGLSSYLMRQRVLMLAVSTFATAAWSLYFYLCDATTASVLVLLAAVRIAVSTTAPQWTVAKRRIITAGFLGLVLAGATVTWSGLPSIPATLASVLLAVATLNFSFDRIRYALLVGDVLWLLNGIALGSQLGAVAAALGLAINTIVLLQQSNWRQRLQFSVRAPLHV
jgi:hypothetical protein